MIRATGYPWVARFTDFGEVLMFASGPIEALRCALEAARADHLWRILELSDLESLTRVETLAQTVVIAQLAAAPDDDLVQAAAAAVCAQLDFGTAIEDPGQLHEQIATAAQVLRGYFSESGAQRREEDE